MSKSNRLRLITAAATLALAGTTFAQQTQQPVQPQQPQQQQTTEQRRPDQIADDRNRPASPTGQAQAAQANKPATAGETHLRATTPAQLVGRVVDTAVTGDPKTVAHYFYQPDRQRFLDAQQQPQPNEHLQTALNDLRRTYREKYTQDLTVAAADSAFGATFLRTGDRAAPAAGAADATRTENARTAGSRTEGASPATPTGSAAAGTDPARDTGASRNSAGSATPTGDRAAARQDRDASAQRQNAAIAASHGLPEVQLSLMKEGEDWKLNVPDTLTPQRLQENLARHLSMVNQSKDQWPNDSNQAQQLLAHHILLAVMDQANNANPGARDVPPVQPANPGKTGAPDQPQQNR